MSVDFQFATCLLSYRIHRTVVVLRILPQGCRIIAGKTTNIFISHIHEDDSRLGGLKRLIKSNGMTVRDYSVNSNNPNNARSESYIKSEILAPRINRCSALLVYVSPETRDSKYVNWEIEYAEKKGKQIVGVYEEGQKGCELPESLKKYADAVVGWTGNRIIDAINGKTGDMENQDGSPHPPFVPERFSCK